MEIVYIRMPSELIRLLDVDSRIRGLRRSELIRKIIQDYYEEQAIFSTELKKALSQNKHKTAQQDWGNLPNPERR